MRKLNWTVFVSQTGSEVYNISKELGVLPKLLVTNNIKKLSTHVLEYLEYKGCIIKEIPFNPVLDDYSQEEILNSDLITLHGFLRVLPGDFINKFEGGIFNGHPALISKYPELKGLNKQEDVFYHKEKYPEMGSVIHMVTDVLDDGKIILNVSRDNDVESLDDAYFKLKETSFATWVIFFRNYLAKLDNQ
jgi:folate-dependent phosphoribosylglycinamide formyltransferase PurN